MNKSISVTDTLNYLKKVYELESSLYQQQVLARQIESEINNKPHYEKEKNLISTKYSFFDDFGETIEAAFGWAIIGAIVGIVVNLFIGFACVALIVTFAICGFAFRIFVEILSVHRGNENIVEKNNVIRENNAKIFAENNKKFEERRVYESYLKREYNYLTKTGIGNTESVLKEIYSCNIIFPKYQNNFVAISSFYEYFASGRCQTLAEAYNKYEEELRTDLHYYKIRCNYFRT